MEPGGHPDPIGEGLRRSAQLAAQLVSISVAAAQAYVLFRSRQAAIQAAEDEQAQRALRDQERAENQQARLGWAPALDRNWIAQADLLQAARTWSAAAPYADVDASAAKALQASEDRLRTLHPYAMGIYDRLCRTGLSPTQAMTDAAPFFGRHPFAREGQPSPPRAAITPATPGGGNQFGHADHDDDVTSQPERTRADDPTTVIAAVTKTAGSESVHATAATGGSIRTAGTGHAQSDAAWAAALAAQSFPMTARKAMQTSAAAEPGTRRAALSTAPRQRVMRQGMPG